MNKISPVLVTGGAGFLGGYVLDALRESGDEPVALDRAGVAGYEEVLRVNLVEGPPDLGGFQPRTVIHLAGLAHMVPRGEVAGRRFYEVNVGGTKNLLLGLEQAAELPEALVFVSTVAAYGVEEGEALDEDAPRNAVDPYGESKRQAEDLLVEWGERMGVRIGIVRLPLVAGRGAPGNLGAMVSALLRGRYLGIGRGDTRRSMVLAADVARTLPKVAEMGGVFHLTDGHHPSFVELEDSLCRALGRTPPRRLPVVAARMLAAAGDAAGTVGLGAPFSSHTLKKMTSTLTFSDERARRELGWRPSRVVDAAETLV